MTDARLNKFNSKKAYQLVKDLTSEKQGRSTTIQDKSGKCLTEEQDILSRWTEYFSELYKYEGYGDNTVLDRSQHPEEYLQSTRVDNIPAKLVQASVETIKVVMTKICNKVWKTGE